MPPKRPLSSIFGDDDDDPQDARASGPNKDSPKRAKTQMGAAVAVAAPATPAASSVQAQLDAVRASVQARLQALSKPKTEAPTPAPAPAAAPAAAPSSALSEIQRKQAEIKKRLESIKAQGIHPALQSNTSSNTAASKTPTGIHPALQSRVDKTPKGLHPALQSSGLGSGVGIHPLLKTDRSSPAANPYLAAAAEPTDDGPAPRQRSMHKSFAFSKPGRHIQQADELRREAKMEELKRRIQETARKAGMQDDLSTDEKLLQRQPPPDIEWWDMTLLPGKTYDDLVDTDVNLLLEKGKQRETDETAPGPLLYGKDSPIDPYIQHPIPIPAPSDKITVKPKGVMLTKKEMKKMRRQRRAAELEDRRDKIKMGLLPPDPPKVKLSNLMRVLTSEAVSDPTKVEARVRREVAARKEAHDRMNAERQLTDEQRRAKKLRKVQEDEERGVGCQVYRIRHLISPQHKFKVRKNAQQFHLTGLTLFHPTFALVLVEGPYKGLKGYKRLMTVRIDWTDPGRKYNNDDHDDDDDHAQGQGQGQGQSTGYHSMGTDHGDESVSLADNKCELIFEGPLRERMFHGFRAVACPTDKAGKEALGPKMEGYWDLARRWSAAHE